MLSSQPSSSMLVDARPSVLTPLAPKQSGAVLLSVLQQRCFSTGTSGGVWQPTHSNC